MFHWISVLGAILMLLTTDALAGAVLGVPVGQAVGTGLGIAFPVAGGGIAAIVSAGVVLGVWIARRKR